MLQVSLLSIFAVAHHLISVGACPFHANEGRHVPINNKRRSAPTEVVKTAIEHVRMFNGWRFSVPQTICLDGGYIVDLGGCPGAQTTINGTGKFLIPGLIDSHVHLTDVQSLEDFTSWGCTTALHMNCANYTQCDIMARQPGLATFLRAGRAAVGNGSLHEKQDPTRPKDTLIYPSTDVAQWTEWQFGNGSDYMKIAAEVDGPSTQQQIEIVQLTRARYRRQTMTHAAAVMSYAQAVESQTDGIQHVPDDGILDAATVRKIIAQGQFVTPTLNVFEYAYTTPALEQFFAVQPGSNRSLDHVQANARFLYEAGVPLIAGTDSVGPIPLNGTIVTVPFGLSLHFELQNLVNIVGMSPAEAINAATREAAKWHRVPDRGSLQVGKRADVVMLNSDPLLNITNTLDIERIWAGGFEVMPISPANITMHNPSQ
jgi:imidazolonepropionase-like amidohydrolase